MHDTPFHSLVRMYLTAAVLVFAGSVALGLGMLVLAHLIYAATGSKVLLVSLVAIASFVAVLGYALYHGTLKAMQDSILAMGQALAQTLEAEADKEK